MKGCGSPSGHPIVTSVKKKNTEMPLYGPDVERKHISCCILPLAAEK